MKKKFFGMFDYLLILFVLVLTIMGVLCIYSSSINSEGISVTREYEKQIIWIVVGFILMVLFTVYDFRKANSLISTYAYILMMILLVYTRLFGRWVNGANSWIGIGDFGIQPSEFCKLIFIVFLAKYLYNSKTEIQLKRYVIATIIMLVPMGLILLQPDLGTATVYIPVFLVMCFFAGIPLRYIMFILCFGMTTIVFTVLPVWNTEIAKTPVALISILSVSKLRAVLFLATSLIALISVIVRVYFHGPKYFYWIAFVFSIISFALIASLVFGKVLKYYQIKRLIIFLDPSADPLDSGWNINQSKIAIGAGGIFGQGYLQGTQSHYRFLPQQSTDFIFSILSEEFGFFGGLFVFTIYLAIFIRILMIIRQCANEFGVYIASGVLAMFAYHFFINVGMVMGIMPITGIPLLFLSYGGSSLLTAMSCIGLVMSINYRKKELA